MTESGPRPRPATAADVEAIAALVEAAYVRYVPRLGRRPSPMDDDHAAHVARGEQHVITEGDGAIVGAVVLIPRPDHLFVDNLAVAPQRQGEGLGRVLLDHAEEEARRRGLGELRLYTNVVMTENLAMYPRLGYEETGRETIGPYERVRFVKPLA
jgi:ribosomal protein S18 acetylase RimI-like enzyme